MQLKLLAWEALLYNYPKYRKGYVLMQICLASRNQVALVRDASAVHDEILEIVTRINGAYPGAVLYEERASLSTAARLQLWQQARVVVSSSIREAVNTYPLEYITSRSLNGTSAGVVVLSEFSGFSRVLNGALSVNPWNSTALQAALDQALEMPQVEAEARAKKDLAHILSNTAEDWGRRFLVDLKSMARKHEEHWMAVGFGLASFRMVGMGADFKALDTQQVLLTYRQSLHRCILLDWGGTLTAADMGGFYDQREEAKYEVPDHVLQTLRQLCADANNHVMILSGLSREKVNQAFGGVPNLSLACEHGFHYRVKNGPWEQLLPGVDTSWREVAEAIMRVYSTRTNGAFMNKKGSSIVWNYQHADPEFGAMQARELQYHLHGVLAAFPVVVRVGKGYVEACPKGINKGVMAERMIEIASRSGAASPKNPQPPGGPRGMPAAASSPGLGFVLCVGDDSSDELMFQVRALSPSNRTSRPASLPHPASPPRQALHHRLGAKPEHLDLWTCTVGRKPSDAAAYLGDHNDVVELLKMLSTLSGAKSKRFASMGDLQSMGAAVGGLSGGSGALPPIAQGGSHDSASGVSLAAAARGNSGRKRATLTGGSSSNLAGMS